MEGYIKWHRNMLNWEWRQSAKHYSVFGYCLERANHKDKRYMGELIRRGSFTTSLSKIAMGTGLTVAVVRTVLKDLILTNELAKDTNSKRTMITITNWRKYQIDDMQINKQITSVKQTLNNHLATNKNVKNVKNVKNKYIVQIENLYKEFYPRKEGKANGVKKLVKEIKTVDDIILLETAIKNYAAMSKDSEKKFIKHFSTFAGCWRDYIEIVNPMKSLGAENWTFEGTM